MIILSVIIPTFNSAKSLTKTLDSIISQTFSNYEVLIVDNLSTDVSLEIVKSYGDERIKIISEEDSGIYDAMNKGIAIASGEWIYFLGSDDELFDQNVFSDFYKEVIKGEKTILYGNVILNGNTGWGIDGQVYDGIFTLEKLLKTNIAHQAIFYKRDIFNDNNKYNIAYKICADYDFNLRVWTKYQPQHFDRIIAKFNAGGASTNIKDLNFEKDFSSNIINYFGKILYKTNFQGLENVILHIAKENFKLFKISKAMYLSAIGMYFKLRRKLLK